MSTPTLTTDPDVLHRTLHTTQQVHIYRIPPPSSTLPLLATSWTRNPEDHIFTARLRILESSVSFPASTEHRPASPPPPELKTTLVLENPTEPGVPADAIFAQLAPTTKRTTTAAAPPPPPSSLFALAPYTHPSIVTPATDSSRFFALTVRDPVAKRSATLGLGFEDRAEAFDFGVVLQDVRRGMGMGMGMGTGSSGGGIAGGIGSSVGGGVGGRSAPRAAPSGVLGRSQTAPAVGASMVQGRTASMGSVAGSARGLGVPGRPAAGGVLRPAVPGRAMSGSSASSAGSGHGSGFGRTFSGTSGAGSRSSSSGSWIGGDGSLSGTGIGVGIGGVPESPGASMRRRGVEDFSLKEGERITVRLPGRRSGGGFGSESESGGTGSGAKQTEKGGGQDVAAIIPVLAPPPPSARAERRRSAEVHHGAAANVKAVRADEREREQEDLKRQMEELGFDDGEFGEFQ